jgi:glucose-6-phosphate isomerase
VWNSGTADTCAAEGPFTLEMLGGKSIGTIMTAIFEGVQTTYRNHKLPYVTIELEGITPRELGAFMGLHMATIMYLGELFNVNAFDQPAVEAYKNEARRLLTQ